MTKPLKFKDNGKASVPILGGEQATFPSFLASNYLETNVISKNDTRLQIFSGTANPALSQVSILVLLNCAVRCIFLCHKLLVALMIRGINRLGSWLHAIFTVLISCNLDQNHIYYPREIGRWLITIVLGYRCTFHIYRYTFKVIYTLFTDINAHFAY